jgi:2-polyprenyl-6-methoxyphenol hydroxylase-like FAD-dependent oxidoreductase
MSNSQVLVVGAGPTGLSLAAELHRHGISCRIVEQLQEPVVWSKAAVVHARTMEIFENMGCASAMLARSKPLHGVNMYVGARRVMHATFERIDSPYPHVYGISQHDTEAVLAEHLRGLDVRLERGVRLASFTQDGDGVTAELETPSGKETARASWLVGCDGSHSRVREVTGIPFEGTSYEERLIQADVHVEWPLQLDDDEIVVFLHADGPLACFPLFKDGRYRLIAVLPPRVEREPTLENFQRIMDERGVAGAKVRDPAWMVAFRIHCRMVPRYRQGRVLLAGDAAHIHSPAGGQGMNTGIQDAYNLAWKLALAVRGEARPDLLDSYDAERRPIARATLDATDIATRRGASFVRLRHPIAAELRNQVLGFVAGLDTFRERLAQNIAMLGLHYRESPVVAQDQPSVFSSSMIGLGESEAPNLLDWTNFGSAPAPGDRVGDLALAGAIDGRARLFELLRGTRHTLLLFDGAAATPEGYENLERIGRSVRERWGKLIDVHVVIPGGRKPRGFGWDGSIVNDVDGALHKHFGARSECLYLIRPDGYVAYRCQPAMSDKLEAYVGRVLLR